MTRRELFARAASAVPALPFIPAILSKLALAPAAPAATPSAWHVVRLIEREFNKGASMGICVEARNFTTGEMTRNAVRILGEPTAEKIDRGRRLMLRWVADLNAGLEKPRPFDAVLQGREPLRMR